MIPKISVIIPVYNAALYITRCITSLCQQTLEEVEFLIVNDCTPDNSIELAKTIINSFPNRKKLFKIIDHQSNKGVAQARQTGLNNSTGEYIIHCDPDDWVEKTWLEELYNEIERTKADIVSCDFLVEYADSIEYKPQKTRDNSIDALKIGLVNDIWGACWNKLIKSSIIKNNVYFVPDLNYQEDLLFVYKALQHCKTVRHISLPLYHYNKTNETSITNNLRLEIIKNKFIIKNEIINAELDSDIRETIKNDICKNYEIIELWISANVSNREFRRLFNPFRSTLWKRYDLNFCWKLLIGSMDVGLGCIIRHLYLKYKR